MSVDDCRPMWLLFERTLPSEGKRKGFLCAACRSANTHKPLEASASKRSAGGG
ncbi:hypothetical protein B4113_2907 [Geobacillus sp. B4113_201601]|nr:hypothetical protein B4113_2907 [Geobacillus sp. B4113_201601]